MLISQVWNSRNLKIFLEASIIVKFTIVFSVQMKNWDPLVSGPLLAMDNTPGPECLSLKFSSAKVSP